MSVTTGHGIGWAVEKVQLGHRVTRYGWPNKGDYIYFVPGGFRSQAYKEVGLDKDVEYLPQINIKMGNHIMPWTCTQSDLLALDWTTAIINN